MSDTSIPPAIQAFVDTTNSGDSDGFVGAFTEDAYLNDWGREFRGRDGVASWNRSDNIGRQAHFDVQGIIAGRKPEQYLLTESTYQEFPNLYTGPSLTQLNKISDANPQQNQYRWGSVEIVDWRTADGVPTRGLLYKPEGFDPSKKYPMVVYFYETHTAGLHGYSAPSGPPIYSIEVP